MPCMGPKYSELVMTRALVTDGAYSFKVPVDGSAGKFKLQALDSLVVKGAVAVDASEADGFKTYSLTVVDNAALTNRHGELDAWNRAEEPARRRRAQRRAERIARECAEAEPTPVSGPTTAALPFTAEPTPALDPATASITDALTWARELRETKPERAEVIALVLRGAL